MATRTGGSRPDHLGSPKLASDEHYLILINTVKLEH
jgi:hypothetical protein